jgi:hypothetical protein
MSKYRKPTFSANPSSETEKKRRYNKQPVCKSKGTYFKGISIQNMDHCPYNTACQNDKIVAKGIKGNSKKNSFLNRSSG